jgi:hypothetical protein
MRLFWRFASDQGAVTATSTAGALYAAANLQRDVLAKKWKSGATLATETITLDLGAALPVTAFALWGHNITEDDTLTLTYASDSGFTADTGTISVTWREWYLLEFFASITRRYWKLDILKDASSDIKYAGRLMVGTHYELSSSLRSPGDTSGISKAAAGKTVVTEGGQSYSDISVGLEQLGGDIVGLTAADVDEIETLKDTYLTAVSFVAAADWSDLKRRVLYGKLTNLAPTPTVGPDAWSWRFSQKEQK